MASKDSKKDLDRNRVLLNKKISGLVEATKELVVSYSNFDINVLENTALVYYNATWSGKLRGEDLNLEDKRIVHLRKIENEWKIDLFIHYSLPDNKSETEES